MQDSDGTHGTFVIGHNVLLDASAAPSTAQDTADDQLTLPRAVTSKLELPESSTTYVTEPPGPPYTPLECECSCSGTQSLGVSGNNSDPKGSCSRPLTDNLNNRMGTKYQITEFKINNNGRFC